MSADVCICGHTEDDHRHEGGNQHGSFSYLDDCRADDCDCAGFGVWIEGGGDGDDRDHEPDTVRCTVCGDRVGRGPGGLGLIQHAGKHRREFAEKFGRKPSDYQEVRDRLGRPAFHVDDEEQLSLSSKPSTSEPATPATTITRPTSPQRTVIADE